MDTPDVKGDGLNNLMIASQEADNKVALFYSPFSIPVDINGNPRALRFTDADALIYAQSGTGLSISTQDVNNDGYDDIWVQSKDYGIYEHTLYHGAPN